MHVPTQITSVHVYVARFLPTTAVGQTDKLCATLQLCSSLLLSSCTHALPSLACFANLAL